MGDYWTNPVRHPEDTGIQYLRRTVDLALLQADGNLVPIGALEAGALPLAANVTVQTAFNAGTNNDMILGTVDDDDGFAVIAGIAAQTPGYKDGLKGALTGTPLAASKTVFLKYTPTGTTPTTGKLTACLAFMVKREGEGTAFPNN